MADGHSLPLPPVKTVGMLVVANATIKHRTVQAARPSSYLVVLAALPDKSSRKIDRRDFRSATDIPVLRSMLRKKIAK